MESRTVQIGHRRSGYIENTALVASALRFSLRHQVLLIASIPLFCGMAMVGWLTFLFAESESLGRKEYETRTAIELCGELTRACVLSTQYVALLAKSGDPALRSVLERQRQSIRSETRALHAFCKSDPEMMAAFRRIESLLEVIVQHGEKAVDSMPHSRSESSWKMQMFAMHNALFPVISEAKACYLNFRNVALERLKHEPRTAEDYRRFIQNLLPVFIVLLSLISLAVSILLSKRLTSRLRVLRSNSARLSELQQPDEKIVSGNDEIVDLDRSFRSMTQTLLESIRKEKAIIANAGDVICALSKAHQIVSCSPASLTVWGVAPEFLIGKALTEFVDPATKTRVVEQLDRIRETGEGEFELLFKSPNHLCIPMLWSCRYSQSDDVILCVAHDITERKKVEDLLKQAEARVRSITENTPAAILLLDDRGNVNVCNARANVLFGSESDQLLGRSIATLLKQTSTESLETIIARYKNEVVPATVRRMDGTECPIELSLDVLDTTDKPAYLMVLLDVTEREKLEQLRKQLIALIQKDIAQPLSEISQTLNSLLQGTIGKLNQSGLSHIAVAEEESRRLNRLFADLIAVEQEHAVNLSVKLEPIALSRLVDIAVKSTRPLCDKNQLQLITEDKCSASIMADSDRLLQVLINVLSNAVKFSPPSSVITIRTTAIDSSQVEVSVSDQGRGLPAGSERKIFEAFEQVEASDATHKGGTGLGLAICKSIVEAHGGSIGARNNTDKGACFWIRLPIAGMLS